MIRKIIFWLLFFVLGFALFVAIFYFGKSKLAAPGPAQTVSRPAKTHAGTPIDARAKIDSLMLVVDGLLAQLNDFVSKNNELEQMVAAQMLKIQQLQAESDSLRKNNEAIKMQVDRVEDLSKTLGSMKPEVLTPILAKLPDGVVQILYSKAKSRDKQKILSALPPNRAGRLLKEFTRELL